MLEKFHPGMSFSDVGCEFKVDEHPCSTHPRKHKEICHFVCEAAPEGAKGTYAA